MKTSGSVARQKNFWVAARTASIPADTAQRLAGRSCRRDLRADWGAWFRRRAHESFASHAPRGGPDSKKDRLVRLRSPLRARPRAQPSGFRIAALPQPFVVTCRPRCGKRHAADVRTRATLQKGTRQVATSSWAIYMAVFANFNECWNCATTARLATGFSPSAIWWQDREAFMHPRLRGLSTERQCVWRANKAVSFNCI